MPVTTFTESVDRRGLWHQFRGGDYVVKRAGRGCHCSRSSSGLRAASACRRFGESLAVTGDGRKFRELCTAGLAFKLLHAVVKHGRQLGLPEFEQYDIRQQLDLVGLGTIADLVPLTGENRILAVKGLEQIPRTHRAGLRALLDVAGIDGPVGSFEAGFQMAPRLNAAGRLQSAMRGLDLL